MNERFNKLLRKKIAATIEMSFEIPESEKKKAQEAIDLFKKVLSSLDVAKDHITTMYDPFKEAESIPVESLHENRGVIHRYKEQIKDNFNKTSIYALKAYSALDAFSSDTHIDELINTFKKTMGDLIDQVNVLMDVFGNMQSKEFKNQFISACDSVFSASFEVDKLINERIIDFVNTNIVGSDWISSTKQEIDFQIDSKVPYITQLFEERKEVLGE